MAGKYSRGAQRKVKKVLRERKRGTLKSGRSGERFALSNGGSSARQASESTLPALTASTSHTEEIFMANDQQQPAKL